MASSGIPTLDKLLGGEGYPDKSAILIVGAPGLGKEALGYWFTQKGLGQGDFCLYVTKRSTMEVLKDAKAFGLDFSTRVPFWIAREGGEVKSDVSDLVGLSYNIKDVLKKNSDRRIRVVVDVISALLMLNAPDAIYRFLGALFEDVKKYDATLLGLVEDGMHQPQTLAAMQELFDGVVELRLYEEGLRLTPLIRVRKMLGVQPQAGYYSFAFSQSGLEVNSFVVK